MNRNSTTRSAVTGDPFSDANALENQPRGLRPGSVDGQDPRNSTSSDSSASPDLLQGAGTLVKWSPGHDRRRRGSYLQSSSRPANPKFVFPETQLPRRPGQTYQEIREQQQSWPEGKSALNLGEGAPRLGQRSQPPMPCEQSIDIKAKDAFQGTPMRPERAFPLACKKKQSSSSEIWNEQFHRSRPSGSSINFSRPIHSSISTIRANPDTRTPIQPEHFDSSLVRDLSHSVDFDEFESKEKVEDDRSQTADLITGARQRSSCILTNRRKSKYTIEEEKIVRAEGKKRLRWTRNIFMVFMLIANGVCIAISWTYPEYWYVFVPVILLGNALGSLMVLNLIRWWIWDQILRLFGKTPPPLPTHIPTTIAMVLACYCESYQDLMDTLESLNAQEKVEHHKKMFIIVCDGQVKGKGMAKSTDRILVEDILKPEKEHWFPVGYESWDGAVNGIYASAGIWEGTPYVLLVKKRNLGKRDGLILVRTLLYKYRFRHENPETVMGDEFFRWFCEFSEDCTFENFEWLVGVDADTTFNSTCIYEMHKECLKDPKLVGCSGLIQVGFRTGQWNLWNIYQNTEYIRAQCLRRWHQAHGTGKVSCLPGACQIIKICDETCSDPILIELFGHIPDPKANMIHQVRALAGEDRNYICLIFFRFPKAQTTMSLKAIAYTDPPNGFMVFLSQRKRWTLSTCANDLLIVMKNEMNWFERACSLADVLVWILCIFVMQTLILFIKACINVTDPTFIVCFAIVTMIPLAYGIFVTYWGCETNRLRLQYLLGLVMLVLIGQIVTPIVICYAVWHMDDFSWGKTREIEASDDPDNKPAHS